MVTDMHHTVRFLCVVRFFRACEVVGREEVSCRRVDTGRSEVGLPSGLLPPILRRYILLQYTHTSSHGRKCVSSIITLLTTLPSDLKELLPDGSIT